MDNELIGAGVVLFLLWIVGGVVFVLINLQDRPVWALILYVGVSGLFVGGLLLALGMIAFLPCLSGLIVIVVLGYLVGKWTMYQLESWLGTGS